VKHALELNFNFSISGTSSYALSSMHQPVVNQKSFHVVSFKFKAPLVTPEFTLYFFRISYCQDGGRGDV
jgi:hypothetical protein